MAPRLSRFKAETTPEIEAEATTCDYTGTCAMAERMKMLEKKDILGNINELSAIYEHVYRYCNDEEHPQCRHFRNEMLKAYDIMA